MTIRTYSSPEAFKQALEQRLRTSAKTGAEFARDPLPAWQTPYAAMAREDQLAWLTLDEVTKAAKTFLDPVLAGELDAAWSPATWAWTRP